MNIKNKYYSILIAFLFITFSCSKSDDSIPQDLELNNFIWKGLNAYYLWQKDIPDLQDTRFSSQSQLNNYLSDFSVPENFFESLLNRPTDRFSWIVDDYIALENSFQGINLSNGMEFGAVRYKDGSGNVFGYVRYVIPNSDADNQGITRGMIFNTIDGSQLNENNYQNLLFGSNTNYAVGFSNFNAGNPTSNGNSISLTKTEIQENPIAISKVITDGSQKVGYLMYNQFARNYDGQLNAAFANFKAENIDNLIIDLRYNLGGSVSSATYLGSMITGQFTGQLYSQEVWNEKVMAANSASLFVNNFTDEIKNVDINGNVVLQESINSLGLNKIYFIVTYGSASASELVINSLSSHIEVRLIGDTTRGKQVGSITLYDSDNLRRTGANLNTNHRYAMQPLVLEISNKDGVNYPNGIVPESTAFPGVKLDEDYNNLGVLGERSDPLLDAALIYVATGSKSTFSKSNNFSFNEIFSSKLATPASDNMFTDIKN